MGASHHQTQIACSIRMALMRSVCSVLFAGAFDEEDDEEDAKIGRMDQDVEGEEEDGHEKVCL
jgi:hypothetical protein